MQRFIAILLLVMLTFLLSEPLFAFSSATEGAIPACCRRDGMHHCALRKTMEMTQPGHQVSTITAKCPYCPWATVPAQGNFSVLRDGGIFYASVLSHPAIATQAEAGFRISFDRAGQKRGPPPASCLS
jgi:hypothetical protein